MASIIKRSKSCPSLISIWDFWKKRSRPKLLLVLKNLTYDIVLLLTYIL